MKTTVAQRRIAALGRVAKDLVIAASHARSLAKSGLVYVVATRALGPDGRRWQASVCVLTAAGQKLLDEAGVQS